MPGPKGQKSIVNRWGRERPYLFVKDLCMLDEGTITDLQKFIMDKREQLRRKTKKIKYYSLVLYIMTTAFALWWAQGWWATVFHLIFWAVALKLTIGAEKNGA